MARKRRKSPDSHDRDEVSPSLAKADLRTLVRAIEDRRLYHPVRVRPVRGIFTRDAKVVIHDNRRSKSNHLLRRKVRRVGGRLIRSLRRLREVRPVFHRTRERHRFRVPTRVAICVRRHQRREVLFALKRGNGSGRKRWTEHSGVHCK